jgi:serine protease Do
VPDFENPGRFLYVAGSGSGFIVEPNWIMTNNHVVSHAHRLRITFYSGTSVTLTDKQIKTDPLTDLAAVALPVPSSGHREDETFKIEFANSDDVERGDLVLALGNPLGLKHTVTHGVISAKGRLLSSFDVSEVLQTDTPINKGNSGGPLFDHLGRLVGVNFAIVSDTGFHQGIGFAIPSNTTREVFHQLKDKGEVERGYLGVSGLDLDAESVRNLALDHAGAVLVQSVVGGKPAWDAGVRAGDVIIKYNGESLSATSAFRHLRQLIMDSKVGTHVPLVFVRSGEQRSVEVTVAKRPRDSKRY